MDASNVAPRRDGIRLLRYPARSAYLDEDGDVVYQRPPPVQTARRKREA